MNDALYPRLWLPTITVQLSGSNGSIRLVASAQRDAAGDSATSWNGTPLRRSRLASGLSAGAAMNREAHGSHSCRPPTAKGTAMSRLAEAAQAWPPGHEVCRVAPTAPRNRRAGHTSARVRTRHVSVLTPLHAHPEASRLTNVANVLARRVMGSYIQLTEGGDDVRFDRSGRVRTLP